MTRPIRFILFLIAHYWHHLVVPLLVIAAVFGFLGGIIALGMRYPVYVFGLFGVCVVIYVVLEAWIKFEEKEARE